MEHNRQCWPMLGINQMTLEWANWFLCCSSLRPESWSVGNLYSLYTYVHVSPSSTLFHPLSPIWNHTICVVRFCSDASRMAAECFRICSSSLIFPASSSIQQHPAASSLHTWMDFNRDFSRQQCTALPAGCRRCRASLTTF